MTNAAADGHDEDEIAFESDEIAFESDEIAFEVKSKNKLRLIH